MGIQITAADPADGLLPFGYLSTSGSQIIDNKGRPIRIAAVGWPGGDGDAFVPIGLNNVNYKKTITDIRTLGFNCAQISAIDI